MTESDSSRSLKTLINPIKLKTNKQTKNKKLKKKHKDGVVKDSGYIYVADMGERIRLDSPASGSGNSHLRKT